MKKLFGFIAATLTLFVAATPAFAQQGLVNCPGQFKTLCDLSTTNIPGLIGQVINFAFIIAIIIALIFLIYGGIKWITSGGEKTDVEGARNHVIAAVVGLIIVFLSYVIINIVVTFFTSKSLQDIDIPRLSPVAAPTCPPNGKAPIPGCP